MPDPLDLLFLSQVLHAESPLANRALLARLAPLLADGGRLVVQEHVVQPSRTAPPEGALFAVNMLAMTPGGRRYTQEEIGAWARAAGLAPEGGRRLDGRSHRLVYRRRAPGVPKP